ncbi:MAG: hypothetical protein ACLFQL_06900 [Paracoccaceae bacterium]
MRLSALPFALAAFYAAPSGAQEVSGTVSGTLDQRPAEWHVRAGGTELPRSGWRDGTQDQVIQVTGFATREGQSARDALELRFVASSGPNGLEAVPGRMVLHDGPDGKDWTAGPRDITLDLTTLARNDDDLSVSGEATARLTPEDASGSDRTLSVNVSFETLLQRLPDEE